jgi:UDP-N-acetylglucosamine pyrophosphorylase
VNFFPSISLGPFFTNINDFYERVPNVPSLVNLDSLTIMGDVSFGSFLLSSSFFFFLLLSSLLSYLF